MGVSPPVELGAESWVAPLWAALLRTAQVVAEQLVALLRAAREARASELLPWARRAERLARASELATLPREPRESATTVRTGETRFELRRRLREDSGWLRCRRASSEAGDRARARGGRCRETVAAEIPARREEIGRPAASRVIVA